MCCDKNLYQHVMSERMLEFALKIMEFEKIFVSSLVAAKGLKSKNS